MERISPFVSGQDSLASDRMNLWPIASFNGDETTVLWPIMDFDSRGFAIRPFVAVDEDDVAVLWPLSGWNSRDGEGWFLNTYWDDDAFGIFPITHVEDDWGYFLNSYWDEDAFGIWPVTHVGENNGYFLLSYWKDDGLGIFPLMYDDDDWGYFLTSYWDDDAFGIFPLMHFGTDSGCVLPAYWSKDGWGVFPLSYLKYDASGGYVGPVYWGDDLFGVFPILGLNDTFSYAGPVWWTDDSGGLFPLYHFSKKGDHLEHRLLLALGSWENAEDYHRSWLFPLWYLEKDKDTHTFLSPLGGSYADSGGGGHWLFPVWWHDIEGDTTTDLTPFFYSRRSPRSNTFVSPLAASQRAGDTSWLWAFPTWYSRNTPNASSKSLLPFWYSGESGAAKTSWMLPLYYQHEDKQNYSFYTLLGNYTTSPGKKDLNVYPLWWSSTDNLATHQTFLPFYHYRNNSGLKSLITPLGGYGWDDQGTVRFRNILGPLYHRHQTQDKSFELTGLAWPLYTRWRQDDTTREIVPLLYHRKSTPDSENISMLSYLCQIQLEEDSTSWMMFPFVSSSDRRNVPNPMWHANLFHFYEYGDKQITRLTPFYQSTRNGSKTSSYLFPLYHASETPKEYDLDMLVFLGDYNKTDAGSSYRAWPLASVSRQPKRPDPLYHASLFSYHHYGDRTDWWATPLIGHSSNGDESLSWVLPLTWWERNGRGNLNIRYLMGLGYVDKKKDKYAASGLFPFYDHTITKNETDLDLLFWLGDYNKTEAGTSYRAWPLASISHQPDRPDPLYYLSLFSYHKFADETNWWATPLVGHFSENGESVNWVLPLAWWNRTDKRTEVRYLLGLGAINSYEGNVRSSSLFPIYSANRDRESWLHYLHLFNWSSRKRDYHFGITPIFGVGAFTHRGRRNFNLNILCGLAADYDSWKGDRQSGSSYSYLLLAGGKSRSNHAAMVPKNPKLDTVSESSGYIFPLYASETRIKRRWKDGALSKDEMEVLGQWWLDMCAEKDSQISNDAVTKILKDKGFDVTGTTDKALRKAVLAFAKAHCNDDKESSFWSIVYRSMESSVKKEWSFLFKAAFYRSNALNRKSTLSILRYLYYSKQEGDVVRRSFFPFCTYDTEGEASDFSFLWRLWHRKKDKNGETSGHILFIPWG